MTILFFFILFVYAIAMLFYAIKFKKFDIQKLNKSAPQTKFSIIIPFRNEVENLPNLIKSLSELDYPEALFDIYFIDDFSEDDSKLTCLKYIKKFKLKNSEVLINQNLAISPKKSAVLTALQFVESGYVLTTDADCLLPDQWLLHFDEHIQKYKSVLVAGAVCIATEKPFWSRFQVLDLMSLQVVGLGSFNTKYPLMCNAANLAYEVKTLKGLQAFHKHQQHISGDDIFNLQVFQQAGKKISALVHPEALVWTKAESSFKKLTQQRIRWASKTKFYDNKILIGLGLLVFISNLILVLCFPLLLVTDDFEKVLWLIWLIKLSVDFMVLKTGQKFFKPGICMRDYVLMLIVYPFVNLYFAMFSFLGKFTWKGRQYEI